MQVIRVKLVYLIVPLGQPHGHGQVVIIIFTHIIRLSVRSVLQVEIMIATGLTMGLVE